MPAQGKPGRPRVAADKAKSSLLSVRLSEDERRAVELAAAKCDEKPSAWARRVLLVAAMR